jgi:hypothetical protein
VGVKIKVVESDFFVTHKDLRRDDPLWAGLFNFVVDVFAKLVIKNVFLVKGICPKFLTGWVVCLQYADITLLFLEKYTNVPANLKLILTCFEQILGMRINYHKSEPIPINMDTMKSTPFVEYLFKSIL